MSAAQGTPATAPETAKGRSGCSARSGRLLKPPLSYIGTFIRAQMEGLWDAEQRPGGWIPLVVAENKLGNPLLLERLEAVSGYPSAVLNYSGMKGIPEFQACMARLLQCRLLAGREVDPTHLCISAGCSAILDNLFYCICDAGDGVLIPGPYYPAFDNDLMAKCEVHPLPFYLSEGPSSSSNGAGGSGWGASNGSSGGSTGLSVRQQLDAAAEEAAARGIPVRGLLITNPNNPLGTIYREDTVLEMLRWCLDRGVHYVSDEIYGLSVFKQGAAFTSAITLAQTLVQPNSSGKSDGGIGSESNGSNGKSNGSSGGEAVDGAAAAGSGANGAAAAAAAGNGANGAAAATAAGTGGNGATHGGNGATNGGGNGATNGGGGYSQRAVDTYVHLVYGLSKDWCASGLRVGVLYSRNVRLQQALNSVCAFASVSNHTQWALSEVLSDDEWVDGFLAANQRLLEGSYDGLTGSLGRAGIPFLPAVGGMFVWIDLRHWLAEPTWEGELALWLRVCDEAKVMLTPGKDCHASEPGFFRLCFAWVPPEALEVAVGRLEKVLTGGKVV